MKLRRLRSMPTFFVDIDDKGISEDTSGCRTKRRQLHLAQEGCHPVHWIRINRETWQVIGKVAASCPN